MPAIKPMHDSVTITQNNSAPEVSDTTEAIASQQDEPTTHRTKRGEDYGDTLLAGMAQFLMLARKIKQPSRLLDLVLHVCGTDLPETLTQEAQTAKAALTPKQRTQLYTWLRLKPPLHLSTLEKISARVNLLTDTFGHHAVMTVLDRQDVNDALALKDPTDKWSRAMHLYLEQFVPAPDGQSATVPYLRFEQAERRQSMNQHWNSKEYASHYLGPIEAEPLPPPQFAQNLRQQVAALYPGINPDLIVWI